MISSPRCHSVAVTTSPKDDTETHTPPSSRGCGDDGRGDDGTLPAFVLTVADKQKRKADHIAEGYRRQGLSKKKAQAREGATVNKQDGGGKLSGSARALPSKKSKATAHAKRPSAKTPARPKSPSPPKTAADRSRAAKRAGPHVVETLRLDGSPASSSRGHGRETRHFEACQDRAVERRRVTPCHLDLQPVRQHLSCMTSTTTLAAADDKAIDDEALLRLGHVLQAEGYRFTTVTPATHARHVQARGPGALATTLRDVLGWNLPFVRDGAFAAIAALLDEAGALHELSRRSDGVVMVRSGVRCASIGDRLFIHGSFPTDAADAVFLGPDTLRFCRLLEQRITTPVGRVLDVGTGSGAAGILLASQATSVVLTDTNDEALRLARINATLAGVGAIEVVRSDGLRDVDGDFDLIVVNPPYLADPQARTYRHGGSMGIELGVRFVEEGLRRLRPSGRLIVYMGTPVIAGRDLFSDTVAPLIAAYRHSYEEIDPDVFGEEIGEGVYRDVERIAVVALDVIRTPAKG